MPFGDSDIPALLADMGVPVVIGAVSTTGLLDDLPGQEFERGRVQSRIRSVAVQTSVLPSLHIGDAITVDGTAYTIREWGPDPDSPDGAMTRIGLANA